MTQALLIHSRVNGGTGWIPVKKGSFVRISGMEEGDLMKLSFCPGGGDAWVTESGNYEIPVGTKHVRIEHEECSGNRVSADLMVENG